MQWFIFKTMLSETMFMCVCVSESAGWALANFCGYKKIVKLSKKIYFC